MKRINRDPRKRLFAAALGASVLATLTFPMLFCPLDGAAPRSTNELHRDRVGAASSNQTGTLGGVLNQDELLSAPRVRVDFSCDLTIHVSYGTTGRHACDVEVRAVALESRSRQIDARATTDANGLARLRVPRGLYRLRADRSNGERVDCRCARLTHALSLPDTVASGRVLNYQDGPIPGASIWLSAAGNPTPARIVGRSDADGSFHIRGIDGTRFLWAEAAGYVTCFPLTVDGNASQTPLIVRLRTGSCTVRGQVSGADGLPLHGAAVLVDRSQDRPAPGSMGITGHCKPPLELFTDQNGMFAATGLSSGPVLVRARHDRAGYTSGVTVASIDASQVIQLQMPRTGSAEGAVVDSFGLPSAGAVVEYRYRERQANRMTRFECVTNEQGSFRIRGLPEGEVRIRATTNSEHGCATCLINYRESTSIAIRLEPAESSKLEGRLITSAEQAKHLTAIKVVATPASGLGRGQGKRFSTRVRANGSFELRGVGRQPVRLELYDWKRSEFAIFRAGTFEIDSEALICVPDEAFQLGSVQALLFVEQEGPLQGARVRLSQSGMSLGVSKTSGSDGSIGFDGVPAGDYELWVTRPHGEAQLARPRFTVHAGEVRSLGGISLEQLYNNRVIATVAEAPVNGATISILDLEHGRTLGSGRIQDGTAITAALPRSRRVVMTASTPQHHFGYVTADTAPSDTTVHEIPMQRGCRVTVEVAPSTRETYQTLLIKSNSIPIERRPLWRSEEPKTETFVLPAGRVEFMFCSDDGATRSIQRTLKPGRSRVVLAPGKE